METIKLLLLSGVLIHAISSAQGPTTYDGKWSATYLADNGSTREAELVVSGSGGSWTLFVRGTQAKNNPCLGREHSITVQSSSPSEMKFTVDASKTLSGCKDSSVTVKSIDAKTLEGQFGDGRALKLVRH